MLYIHCVNNTLCVSAESVVDKVVRFENVVQSKKEIN
jgi:hypothetical protein